MQILSSCESQSLRQCMTEVVLVHDISRVWYHSMSSITGYCSVSCFTTSVCTDGISVFFSVNTSMSVAGDFVSCCLMLLLVHLVVTLTLCDFFWYFYFFMSRLRGGTKVEFLSCKRVSSTYVTSPFKPLDCPLFPLPFVSSDTAFPSLLTSCMMFSILMFEELRLLG